MELDAGRVPRFVRDDDQFLLAFLRNRKHDPAAALTVITSFSKLWYSHPDIVEGLCADRVRHFQSLHLTQFLDGRDVQGNAVVALYMGAMAPGLFTPKEQVEFSLYTLAALFDDEAMQLHGVTYVETLAGFSIWTAMKVRGTGADATAASGDVRARARRLPSRGKTAAEPPHAAYHVRSRRLGGRWEIKSSRTLCGYPRTPFRSASAASTSWSSAWASTYLRRDSAGVLHPVVHLSARPRTRAIPSPPPTVFRTRRPWYFTMFWGIVRPFLPSKMGSRLRLFGHNYAALHKCVAGGRAGGRAHRARFALSLRASASVMSQRTRGLRRARFVRAGSCRGRCSRRHWAARRLPASTTSWIAWRRKRRRCGAARTWGGTL